MIIQLFDLDIPYDVAIDMTSEGKNIIRIKPQAQSKDRDEDYDICLDYDLCQELIRTLQFISNEIKPKE